MDFSEILLPNQGTKLYKNRFETQYLKLTPKESKNLPPASKIMYVAGNKIDRFSSLKSESEHILTIYKNQEYMIVNLSEKSINLDYTTNPNSHIMVYDPYLYKNESQKNIDVEEFKKSYDVPDGFTEVLSKWYSIKFTYPKLNLIYIKPGLGISFQIHKMRSETWEIGLGKPIVIIDSKIEYQTKEGDTFKISKGTLHSIINATNDWVLVKERFTGTFNESDIKRIFNPNNYKIK